MRVTRNQLRQIIQEEISRINETAGDGKVDARDADLLRKLASDISSQGEDPSNRYVVVNYIPLTTSTGKYLDPDIDGHVTYIDKEFDDKEELEATIARGSYWLDDYGDEITGDDASDLWAALDKYKSERG